MDKTCWSCGHWLLGLGCCVDGVNEFVPTEVDYVCDKWLPEGTEGTVTDFIDIGEEDGTTREEKKMTNIEKMNELVGTNATKKEIKDWAYSNRIHVVSLHLDAEEFSEMEKSVDAFYNSDFFSADEHANWEKFLDSEFVS